jgi:hypothetical protein
MVSVTDIPMRRTAAALLVVCVVLWMCCKSHDQNAPRVPSGTSAGFVDSTYNFWTMREGQIGGSACYRFDWGSGDTSAWSAYIAFGDTLTLSHSWFLPGTYNVRAQSKDYDGTASGWSDGHSMLVYFRWSRTFGGADYECGNSVQQTQDGGYIVAGNTGDGSGRGDIWLVRVDAGGHKMWDVTFDRAEYDAGYSVRQTRDGGYIIVGGSGWANTDTEVYDVWLVKTDAAGNKVWDKTFDKGEYDCGYAVEQTQDGGYIIAGHTFPGVAGGWLIKTDAAGNKMWDRTFGGDANDACNSVQQTQDGGYIIAGTIWPSDSGDVSDVWLIKTDVDGNKVWAKTFGGATMADGKSVQQTRDGGYVVAGVAGQHEGDVWLIRTDADGNKVWDKTLGGARGEEGNSVQQTQDGGYIITGYTESFGAGGYDVWLIKTDANGDTVWTRSYGGTEDDVGYSVQQTQDGGYIITGYTASFGAGGWDLCLIKTDANGETDGDFVPSAPETTPRP